MSVFAILSIVAYWPAFFSKLIWDDHFLVGHNPFFRSPALALATFRNWLYPYSTSTYFRPVQNLSYILDYWLWGEKFVVYHLTNALLHAVVALLLAILVRRIANAFAADQERRNELLGFAVALIWIVHPIHHAAVAYISGRADSLAAVFALVGWLLAERSLETNSRTIKTVLFASSAVAGALALFSKEIAITWICLFVIYQTLVPCRQFGRTRTRAALAACMLVFLYIAYRQTLPYSGEPFIGAVPSPLSVRVLQAARALGDYISLVILPVNLHMERQLHLPTALLRMSHPWLYYHAVALIPLGLCGLGIAGWFCAKRGVERNLNFFLVCWFIVGFVPISNLFPLNSPVAEHWIYMPSVALIILLVKAGINIAVSKRYLAQCVIGVVTVALLFLTNIQSRTWVTEEAMFRTAFTRGGDTAKTHVNLARVLEERGEVNASEALIREALTRYPGHPVLVLQLTRILQGRNQVDDALALLRTHRSSRERVRVPMPFPWVLEAQEVDILFSEKRLSEAQSVLSVGLKRWPYAWDLLRLQALTYAANGRFEQSVELLENYVLRNWWNRDALIMLARHLTRLGRLDDAVERYRLAGRLDLRNAKPWEQIAIIREHQGNLADALEAQKKAVHAEPRAVEQRLRLAQLYAATGNQVEALIERGTAEDLLRKGY